MVHFTPMSHDRRLCRLQPSLFCRSCLGSTPTSARPATNWQSKALSRSRPIYSGVRDINDTLDTVAKLPECTGKIAVLGYCLGALMTFLTAVRCHVDAAVAYHGADTEKYLGEVDNLSAPLLMHLGEEDEFISKPAQAEIKDGPCRQAKRDGLQLSGAASRLRSA